MPDPARELIRLAMERFGNLWPAEAKMLRAAAEGTTANVADQPGDETLTRESAWGCWEQWGEHRKIRAEVLRWVLVDDEAAGLVHEQGMNLQDALVEGRIELVGGGVRKPLVLVRVAAPEGMNLRYSRLSLMALRGCAVGHVLGEGMVALQSVLLRECRFDHGLRVVAAEIHGELDCAGSLFAAPTNSDAGGAISADGIRVAGTVRMCEGFSARGGVRLNRARVGRNLFCQGGTFSANDDDPPALGCVGIRIEGSLSLAGGAAVSGRLVLSSARIGNDLNAREATFENSGGEALLAIGLEVQGSVYLERSAARGECCFRGARIGGDFVLAGATLSGRRGSDRTTGSALDLDRGAIAGTVDLSGGASIRGEVRLRGATIGGSIDLTGCVIDGATGVGESVGYAMRAEGVRVAGDVVFGAAFHSRGEVRLLGATIDGALECNGARFENPIMSRPEKWRALSLHRLDVSRGVYFRGERPAHAGQPPGLPTRTLGSIVMVGARVGRDLQIQMLECDGDLNIDRASIESTLRIDPTASISGVLDLSDARVARLRDSLDAWRRPRRLNLHGFRYGSFTDECDMTVADRIDWVGHGGVDSNAQAVFSAEPYQQLARVYASMGRSDDAVKVRQAQFRARREHERPRSFWDISGACWYWWRWLVIRLLGCGYNRLGPLYAMFVLWLIGGLVFQAANRQGLMVPASDQVLTTSEYQQESGRKVPLDYQPMNVWTYSADAMLPFIDLHQERFWLPKRDPDPDRWRAIANLDRGTVFGYPFPDAGRFVRWYLWFHIAAGWILSTLFVVGLSGIVKNEDGKSQDE
ncbi:MAG: hypothetical protein HUU19_01385 [Phycisphaerales bacterium]|nr:hypothetical protein [Phycisphaerales bacterium]